MHVEQTELSRDLVIVGLALHTDPPRAEREIPALWQRFMRDNVAERIPRRADDQNLYCVYCDYASDHRGPYTMVLGHAVDAAAEVPAGLRRVRIPAGNYAKFLAQGDPTEVVTATWRYANQHWQGASQRRYIADFERYRPGAMTPNSVESEILIGLS